MSALALLRRSATVRPEIVIVVMRRSPTGVRPSLCLAGA
jgi:hypothetical protein